jgi:stalled ribosome rescue protein Dom34
MELLDEIHQQEGSDIYVLLQISILYLHFDDFEKVLNIMSEVEQLSKTVELNEWARKYLK